MLDIFTYLLKQGNKILYETTKDTSDKTHLFLIYKTTIRNRIKMTGSGLQNPRKNTVLS